MRWMRQYGTVLRIALSGRLNNSILDWKLGEFYCNYSGCFACVPAAGATSRACFFCALTSLILVFKTAKKSLFMLYCLLSTIVAYSKNRAKGFCLVTVQVML